MAVTTMMPPLRARHLLLLGWPILAYAVRDFMKNGLHPDDRKGRRR
jgi:hypothetical protein